MADPAQVQGTGSGEGSTEVKATENAPVKSKAVEEVKVESNTKTDNVQPEQAEAKTDTTQIATQTPVPDVNTKTDEPQAKAPQTEPTNTPAVAEKKEDNPIKESVLIAEINVAKVEPKDALTVSPAEAKDAPITSAAEAKDVPILPVADVKNTTVPPTEAIDTTTVSAVESKTEDIKPEGSTSVNTASEKDETQPKVSEDWQLREQELLKKIEELEKFKKERSEDGLKLELKVREEEIDLLKARVKNLETELQAALSKPGGKNQEMIEKIKQQHEELLSKARGMIFDKTKMVKNQELQIEALTTQVQSLKDINLITKDLLEIRNSEVKAMEDRLQVMEARFKAEKERYDLVLKRAQTSTNINDDLRREYETQLALFKELREKYELRVQALVAENNRLKELSNGGTSG